MSDKKISVSSVIAFLGGQVLQVHGNTASKYFSYLRPASNVDADTLDWVHNANKDKQKIAESSVAKIVVVDPEVEYTPLMEGQDKVLIVVANPKLSLVNIGNHFFVEKPAAMHHPSAVIHPGAQIGENCYIGAGVYIGACTIGNNTYIYPNVAINDGVVIGNNVSVKAGAVIGFEGFGFEKDEQNNLIRFPQLGGVYIHDNVEIGANTCIDRGSLSDTVIGYNTKINNLCHIAHNVVIGKNVVVTALVNISGSTVIEDGAWISPASSFKGHQRVGNNAIVGMGAVVTKDVPAGEVWFGNPAKKIK